MHKSNEISLKDAITEMLELYRLDAKLKEYQITDVWANLMGKGVANYTKSVVLKKQRLYITLNNAPLKNELSYAREKIVKMLNDYYGKAIIEEVIIL